MFTNFKVKAHMAAPIATAGIIILDSILSAAKAKELLKDEYYSGENIYGSKTMIDEMLGEFLDNKSRVYCTSGAVGDYREFVGSWAKRWDDKNDDLVRFTGRGKHRVDVGAGYFKNYHMPLIIRAYDTITFYVRGEMEEVKRLLNTHINYIGKKGSQGYGEIARWEFEPMDEDYSLWKDNKPMRPIPARDHIEWITKNNYNNLQAHAIIPPYWRDDEKEICIMPST